MTSKKWALVIAPMTWRGAKSRALQRAYL